MKERLAPTSLVTGLGILQAPVVINAFGTYQLAITPEHNTNRNLITVMPNYG